MRARRRWPSASPRGPRVPRALGALVLAACCSAACASVDFDPQTETSGEFSSRAFTFTLLGKDFPGEALRLARGNASDSGLPNLLVREERVFPYLWRLDWILDIVSFRWASVSGTWGDAPESAPR